MSLEDIRRSYKPDTINVLFIGESPPAGGTFFYNADSNLYRYTQEAFSLVYGDKCGSGTQFLDFFKELGCYLDDLSLEPINHLDDASRKMMRRNAAPSLGIRIREYQPKAIAVVMAPSTLRRHIGEALRIAQLQPAIELNLIEFHPFPAQGNQWRYVDSLTETLKRFRQERVIE